MTERHCLPSVKKPWTGGGALASGGRGADRRHSVRNRNGILYRKGQHGCYPPARCYVGPRPYKNFAEGGAHHSGKGTRRRSAKEVTQFTRSSGLGWRGSTHSPQTLTDTGKKLRSRDTPAHRGKILSYSRGRGAPPRSEGGGGSGQHQRDKPPLEKKSFFN